MRIPSYVPERYPRIHGLRCVVYPAKFADLSLTHGALDEFVAEKCEEPATQEQRTRVPVPVDTRRATTIVSRFVGLRAEFADNTQLHRVVTQKDDRRRRLKQVVITRPARHTDR